MNRIFVIIAVLVLCAGTAFAGNLNDLQTADLAANATARSRVSDSSVLIKIWNTNANTNPARVIVTNNTTLALIEAGTQMGTDTRFGTSFGYMDSGSYTGIITSATTADTIGEVVDIINSDTSGYWKAAVGPDAYRAMSSKYLYPDGDTESTAGSNEDQAAIISGDSSGSSSLTCGIAAKANTVNRIKSITHRLAESGNLQIAIYDGDTKIYRKDISRAVYNSASSTDPSPSTVNFAAVTNGRGLASSKGNSLVVSASTGTLGNTQYKLSDCNITIVYDQVVQ